MNASQQKISVGLSLALHLAIDCKKTFDLPERKTVILEAYKAFLSVSRHSILNTYRSTNAVARISLDNEVLSIPKVQENGQSRISG